MTLLPLAVLFLPLVSGLSTLYPWARPEEVQLDAELHHKNVYLNVSFFLTRSAFYFVVWTALAFLLVSGCAGTGSPSGQKQGAPISQQKENWQVSPTFSADGVTMRGLEGRLAIADMSIQSGKQSKVTWYFWGNPEEVTGKIAVIGNNQETQTSVTLMDKVYMIPSQPAHGAQNHWDMELFFPSAGTWKLDVFIDQQVFDSIVVPVS